MSVQLNIVTPQGPAYEGEVETVVLPGSEGRFGVLEGHERFLAPLKVGEVELRGSAGTEYAAISGGFADVGPDRVVVLAEACELAREIDVARAQRAQRGAEAELQRLRAENADEHEFRLWEAALERAVVRIRTGGRA
ncbi:MAG: ATP synthase F1 subunit epsilon [Myxococcota bacterium]